MRVLSKIVKEGPGKNTKIKTFLYLKNKITLPNLCAYLYISEEGKLIIINMTELNYI